MDIFSCLPYSNRFEENVSGMFKYFFLNSKVFRTQFLDLLAGSSGSEDIFTDNKMISCETEVQSYGSDVNEENGRIDIVIIVDNLVLGIESKFDAVIAPYQPTKYIEEIVKIKNKYSKENAYFTIITTEHRKENAKKALENSKRRDEACKVFCGITWEKIKNKCIDECLDRFKEEDSAEIFFLMKHFNEYLERSIGPIKFFEQLMDHLGHADTSIQTISKFSSPTFLAIQRIFSSHGFEVGKHTTAIKSKMVGAGFHSIRTADWYFERIWIGFIPSENEKYSYNLIVHIVSKINKFENFPFGPRFEEVKNPNINGWGFKNAPNKRYIIKMDEQWERAEGISDALNPLIKYLQSY
jgi:hypothetical protein